MRSILPVPLASPFIELSHRRQLLLRQNHSAAVGVYVFLKNIVGAIRSSTNDRRKSDKVPFHPMDPFSSVPFRVRPPKNVLARTRVPYTIVRVFCLQSFTFWLIGLLFRWLRVKAKALLPSPESGDFSLSRVFLLCTDDEGFIGLGEGSEGKMQGYCVV